MHSELEYHTDCSWVYFGVYKTTLHQEYPAAYFRDYFWSCDGHLHGLSDKGTYQ